MKRLSRFAPEEIAGALMLAVVLLLLALRPATVADLLASPYATPDPSGGPGLQIVVPAAAPTIDMWPRPTPATAAEAAGWIRWGNGPARVMFVGPTTLHVDGQCPEAGATPTPVASPNVPVSVLCVRSVRVLGP